MTLASRKVSIGVQALGLATAVVAVLLTLAFPPCGEAAIPFAGLIAVALNAAAIWAAPRTMAIVFAALAPLSVYLFLGIAPAFGCSFFAPQSIVDVQLGPTLLLVSFVPSLVGALMTRFAR
jgi:hypothetical protein